MKTPRIFSILTAATLLLPTIASAQQAAVPPAAAPSASVEPPSTLPPGASLEPAPTPATPPATAPAAATNPTSTTTQAATPREELPTNNPTAGGNIRVNFQGASLNDVLNYLSDAAGFVIVQEGPLTGTVNVVSRQPVTAEEAVDLLNTVLYTKGYVAIRNGRILKIVNRTNAAKQDIPVTIGSDPQMIPKKDSMVTQILPVKYVDATKLVDNLRPLLAADANISSNESSNSIILTDTQANIRRIAEIISALDTSISGASSIRVFPLHFADAKQLADVLTQLFASTQSSTNTQQNQGGFGGRGGFGGFGGFGGRGGGGGAGGNAAQSTNARQQAAKVVVVADQQSNSIIVSAPDDVMPSIADIVNRTDTNIADITETRLFQLKHADATEMATVLTSLYSANSGATTQTSNNNNRGNQGGFGNQQNQQRNNMANSANTSQRALLQAQVVAVADARTNTVLVTASRDTMLQIAETVGRLDASEAKKQHIYTYSLQNADADTVATILRGMFTDQSVNTANQTASNQVLTNRQTSGASNNATSTMNFNSSGSGSGGGTLGGR